MKIIRLTMNAFLAYKDKTTICFDDVVDHGIYLISGPTGSGKTTLFDAMTFALYGEASGSQRSHTSLRSDYADSKDETYVEMEFELGGVRYTIKRSPTYTRPGYKTAKMANAILSYHDQVIEGVKEVNRKINDILGVDVHQFKQIVMIAQGEFTKLIYASSEEREKVLRHIFHSESLVVFENLLKEKTKDYKDQYLFSNQHLQSQFSLLKFSQEFMQEHQLGFHISYIKDAQDENETYFCKQQQLQQDYEECKAEYERFSQELYRKKKFNEDIKNYQALKQQYQLLLSQTKSMDVLYQDILKRQMIEKNQSLIYQYQQVLSSLETINQNKEKEQQKQLLLKQQFEKVNQDYQKLDELYSSKDQYTIDIENLKQKITKQQDYLTLKQKYESKKKTYDYNQQQYNTLLSSFEKLQTRMQRDQETVNQLPYLESDLALKEQNVKDMNQKRISIHNLSEWYDLYNQYQDQHYELSQQYNKLYSTYQDILHQYQHEDENFKRHQAGIMALHLKENEPCPVCGSLHHPHLAVLSEDVLSSQQLEELNIKVEEWKKKVDESYQEIIIQNEQRQTLKTKIDLLKKQLEIDEELSKEVFIRLLSHITQVTKDSEKNYQKHYNQVLYLKRLKKSLQKDQETYDQDEEKLKVWKQEIDEQKETLTQLEIQLSQYDDSYLHHQNFSLELKEKQKLLLQLQNKIKETDENYHQCLKDLSIIDHQLEVLSQQYDETQKNYELLYQQYSSFITHHFQDENELNRYMKTMRKLHRDEEKYQNYCILKETKKAQLNQYPKDIQDAQIIDLSKKVLVLKEKERKKEELFQQYQKILQIYQNNLSMIQKIEKEYQKNQDIFEKYSLYQDLYDMTSGKNGQRMSFERYVLSSYFEHILEYANIEFLKMSQGRFALYRKKETKGSKQQGLDLCVLDYETGMMRDIQSLSGGESFKAALSLALGLSSMIQSYAGGIELNTLFIDEGFGSLDHESIDQALSCLMDLDHDSKVIGIISHVDELKERIQTQIVVSKGKNGSYLHIEKY